jgi:hypothetical protein
MKKLPVIASAHAAFLIGWWTRHMIIFTSSSGDPQHTLTDAPPVKEKPA